VNDLVRQLATRATADIAGDKLKADVVIAALFAGANAEAVDPAIVERARLRKDLGNPPGKNDSLGDAINWEWLLDKGKGLKGDELVIVSSDTDFESELTKGKLREYLLREWSQKNPGCKIRLVKSLEAFIGEKFPEIQLLEAAEKTEAIKHLEDAWSFHAAHVAVAGLNEYDDFNDAEVKRILTACTENSQVRWIIGDDDVKALALRVAARAKSDEAKALASEILKIVAEQ
jgi:hypothetical protein